MDPQSEKPSLSHAKRRRGGKKSAITRKINEINNLVTERGSRTKIKYLRNILKTNLNEAIQLHEELMLLLDEKDPDFNDEWINNLSFTVDTCIAGTEKYFLDRIDDPDSTEPDIKSDVIQAVEEWRKRSFGTVSSETTYTERQPNKDDIADKAEDRTIDSEITELISRLQLDQAVTGSNLIDQPNIMQLKKKKKLSMSDGDLSRPKRYVEEYPHIPTYLSEGGERSESIEQNWSQFKKLKSQLNAQAHEYHPNEDDLATTNPKNVLSDHVTRSLMIDDEVVNLTNNLPDDHTIPDADEDLANLDKMLPDPPIITYDYVEDVKSHVHIPKFHSTYTVLPRRNTMVTPVRSLEPTHNLKRPILSRNPGRMIQPQIFERSMAPQRIYEQPKQTDQNCQDAVRASREHNKDKIPHTQNKSGPFEKSVDGWIDNLDPLNEVEIPGNTEEVNITMQMLIQQRLPRLSIPNFDGTPELWVDFIGKFYDMVHKQPFLDSFQKHAHLIQNLRGEPLKAVRGFNSNYEGYVQSLQRLKYMFGNRSLVAQATIQRLVSGKQLENNDVKGLNDYYYTLSHCMNTLKKMRYYADMYSSDVLRQALKRLPPYLLRRWGEYCLILRRREEPSLEHLEIWLQDRVMAAKDPNLPIEKSNKHQGRYNPPSSNFHLSDQIVEDSKGHLDNKQPQKRVCQACGQNHHLTHKCTKYVKLDAKERLTLIKSKKCCFNCLSPLHQQKDCKSKYTCLFDGCKGRHHTTLHTAFTGKSKINTSLDPPREDSSITTKVHTTSTTDKGQVFLKIVPIKVTNASGQRIKTYALLDEGSQCTIIRKDFCQSLRLNGEVKHIDLGTLKGSGHPIQSKIVDIEVSSLDRTFVTKIPNVFSIEKKYFNVPSQKLPNDPSDDERWKQIRELNISDVDRSKICVLIGADAPNALIVTESRGNGPGIPLTTKTRFGWAIVGPYKRVKSEKVSCNHLMIKDDQNDDLNQSIQKFWEIESFGTSTSHKGKSNPMSIQETKILQHLKSETKLKDGHYEVPMIWKEDMYLPDSFKTAKRRFEYLSKKLQKDESYFKMYKACIDKYIRLGHARKLSPEEVKLKTPKTWYLPHHGVINENKPGRVQVVFDAAAKSQGICLNSNLLAGPDLLNNLVGILLKFREHPIAITGDIEGMFNQVLLKEEDREAVRFLWKESPNESEPSHYQMLVHIFGAKDSPTCANFALKQCAENVKGEFSEEAIKTVKQNFYMDDLIKSIDEEEEGVELVQELCTITDRGRFNLHKFNSNSQRIVDSIPVEKRAKNIKNIIDDREIARALGIKWDLKSDFFTFFSNKQIHDITKRSILSLTSTIFDPLGFLSPFIVRAKQMIQKLWRKKFGWDEPVDKQIEKEWNNWRAELNHLPQIQIPRFIGTNKAFEVELHTFCDASELAYDAVCYVRVKQPGKITCNLIMSKSRVAPVKQISLPRLELEGAVLASNLAETVVYGMETKFQACHFWTDSMLNLQYINNEDRRFKAFVANRVTEIRDSSNPEQWHHIDGKSNPADLATRGLSLKEIMTNKLWLHGPEFLWNEEINFEAKPINSLPETHEEVKREKMRVNTIRVPTELIEFDRFSSWKKLINTVSWMGIFVGRLLHKISHRENATHISLNERQEGETVIIKLVQAEVFHGEVKQLKVNKRIPSTSKLKNLDPFLDESGVLRVGGRLKFGKLPYASKHQIILPNNHYAVKLLVRHLHNSYYHVGKEQLLSIVRQNYWIVNSRKMLWRVIKGCIKCQNVKAKPYTTKMSNLPADRLEVTTPFSNTGVDYFGPITVKILRSRAKRWGCIFTCLTTRAVHLEVAPSLETDDFLNVFERFVNRRGCPKIVRSDCGTNFKGADRVLDEEWMKIDRCKVSDYATKRKFQWIFNPPEAPHMGGVWERMIRSAKTTLQVIFSEQSINDFTLMSAFTQVEALINGRPLTPNSDDIRDLEALTPNHFLIGRADTAVPVVAAADLKTNLRKRWKQTQELSTQFWNRWQREYLPSLTKRAKWYDDNNGIKIGELVLVLDKRNERGMWPLGRVLDVYASRDGRVRKVVVKTNDGTYTRPVVKLSKLELFESQTLKDGSVIS